MLLPREVPEVCFVDSECVCRASAFLVNLERCVVKRRKQIVVALLALSVAACTGHGVTAPTADISTGPTSVVPAPGAAGIKGTMSDTAFGRLRTVQLEAALAHVDAAIVNHRGNTRHTISSVIAPSS